MHQHRAAVAVEDLSDLGDRHAPRRALQQAYAEPRLERGDPAAELGLGFADRARRGRETAVLDDAREVVEVVEIGHHGIHIVLLMER
jgi:hypothetical protein